MSLAGTIKMERGEFWYVGKSGNWFAIKVWVQGDTFHIATSDLKEEYSVIGEFKGIAQVPFKSLI